MAVQKQFVLFFILVNIHGSLLSTFNAIDQNSKIQKGCLGINLVYKRGSNNYVEFEKKIVYNPEECNDDKNNEIPEDEIMDPESNIVSEFEKSIINELNNYIYNTLPVQEINENNGDEESETPEDDETVQVEEDDDKMVFPFCHHLYTDKKQKYLDANHIPSSEKNKSSLIVDNLNLNETTVNTKYDHCELENDSNKPQEKPNKSDIIENKAEASDKKSTDSNKNKIREDYENHLVDVLTLMFDSQRKRFIILNKLMSIMNYETYEDLMSDKKIRALLKLIKEEDAKHSNKKFIGTDIDFDSDLNIDVYFKSPGFWVYDGSDRGVYTKSKQIGSEKLIRNIKQSLTNVLNRERESTLTEADNDKNLEANTVN